ncbi:MAG: hypothetical protein ACK5L3_09050 [Oscillospiraceae bacterium]
MRRYGGAIAHILSLQLAEGIDLIKYAIEADAEDFVKARWIAAYQGISFAEFKDAVGFAPRAGREKFAPVTDILADAKAILEGAKAGEEK